MSLSVAGCSVAAQVHKPPSASPSAPADNYTSDSRIVTLMPEKFQVNQGASFNATTRWLRALPGSKDLLLASYANDEKVTHSVSLVVGADSSKDSSCKGSRYDGRDTMQRRSTSAHPANRQPRKISQGLTTSWSPRGQTLPLCQSSTLPPVYALAVRTSGKLVSVYNKE